MWKLSTICRKWNLLEYHMRTKFPGVYLNYAGLYDSYFYERYSKKKIVTAKNEDIMEIAAFKLHQKVEEYDKNYDVEITYKKPV